MIHNVLLPLSYGIHLLYCIRGWYCHYRHWSTWHCSPKATLLLPIPN